MADEYTSKLITTSIRFTSRVSTKIGEEFYTVEACEERAVPEGMQDSIDWAEEKKLLWDSLNDEVDNQIADIYEFKKNKLKS